MNEYIKNELIKLFKNFSQIQHEENKKNYSEVIKNILKNTSDLGDMENFDMFVNWEINKILKVMINELNPNIEDDKLNKLCFAYQNYSYLESNIEKLIELKEGVNCVKKKATHILKCYKKYLLNGSVPEYKDIDEVESFYGIDYKDWFEFCEGLNELYWGKPNLYIKSLKKILNLDSI